MVNLMFTINFRSDMSTKEAHLYWRTTHRDLVLATPGVVAYTQNLKVEDLTTDVPWDGIIELTFADEDTFRAAMTSEEWRSTYADVINFSTPTRSLQPSSRPNAYGERGALRGFTQPNLVLGSK